MKTSKHYLIWTEVWSFDLWFLYLFSKHFSLIVTPSPNNKVGWGVVVGYIWDSAGPAVCVSVVCLMFYIWTISCEALNDMQPKFVGCCIFMSMTLPSHPLSYELLNFCNQTLCNGTSSEICFSYFLLGHQIEEITEL